MTYKHYKTIISNDPRFSKINFEVDGRFHYVYRISKISGNLHYYGSRVTKVQPKEDIGIEYFTSSKDKDFIQDFTQNPELYKAKVIKSFDNSGDKIMLESYLHQHMGVKDSDVFINRSNQNPFGFDTTGISYKCSEEAKKKMSKAKKDTVMVITEDGDITRVPKEEFDNNDTMYGHTKGKMTVRNIRTGEISTMKIDDERLKDGTFEAESKGRVHPQSANDSKSRLLKNGKHMNYNNTKEKLVPKYQINHYLWEGWKFGRKQSTCPHCGKTGRTNMKRYHFDNCKERSE